MQIYGPVDKGNTAQKVCKVEQVDVKSNYEQTDKSVVSKR